MLIGGLSGADAVGLGSLTVTVVGFVVAISQLRRTESTAAATRRAVERTEERIAVNHLLVVLPQFRMLVQDLDAAAEENDRKLAMRTLVAWTHLANEVASMLAGVDESFFDYVLRLRASAKDGTETKADLISYPKRSVKVTTKDFRRSFGELTAEVSGLTGQIRLHSGSAS